MTVRQSIFGCGILCIVIVPPLVMLTRADAQQNTPAIGGDPALVGFRQRVDAYASLHRQLEQGQPPFATLKGSRARRVANAYLSAAVKRARPQAREGDVFGDAGMVFRLALLTALSDPAAAKLKERFDLEPSGLVGLHPRLHDALPDWAPDALPAAVLRYLPELPEDIEYRLLDHDLVLWDIHADLIIDVLRDAVPRRSESRTQAPRSPQA
jgi:hypothetical protein